MSIWNWNEACFDAPFSFIANSPLILDIKQREYVCLCVFAYVCFCLGEFETCGKKRIVIIC